MKFSLLSLATLCAFLLSTATGFRCQVKNGEYVFFDGDDEITPDRFHCLRVETDSDSTLQVRPQSPTGDTLRCSALQDGKASIKVKYEPVQMDTGIMCTLSCKEEPGKYRCNKKEEDGECLCEPQTPHVVVKPVSSEIGPEALLGGQNEILDGAEGHQCHDKAVGFQFQDAVPCISIRAEVTKRRVKFMQGNADDCTVDTKPEMETRYMRTSPDNLNLHLQGCVYACKLAGPRCTEEEDGANCKCASPGMTKQLVPLDHMDVSARFQKECGDEEGACGPCGECKDKLCELKTDAHLGKNCECGKICPMFDERTGPKGGKIPCKSNVLLGCMANPNWLDPSRASYGTGTEFPDLCTEAEGKPDAADTCSCKAGLEEKLGENGTAVSCVTPTPEPQPVEVPVVDIDNIGCEDPTVEGC